MNYTDFLELHKHCVPAMRTYFVEAETTTEMLAKCTAEPLSFAEHLKNVKAAMLDAQENLSVQVHPPKGQAGEPKTEMWYFLETTEEASELGFAAVRVWLCENGEATYRQTSCQSCGLPRPCSITIGTHEPILAVPNP